MAIKLALLWFYLRSTTRVLTSARGCYPGPARCPPHVSLFVAELKIPQLTPAPTIDQSTDGEHLSRTFALHLCRSVEWGYHRRRLFLHHLSPLWPCQMATFPQSRESAQIHTILHPIISTLSSAGCIAALDPSTLNPLTATPSTVNTPCRNASTQNEICCSRRRDS